MGDTPQELDDVILRIFEILEEILAQRQILDKVCLKPGFLNIAKTRFSKGSNAITRLQLDNNIIVPKYLVSRHEEKTLTQAHYNSYHLQNFSELNGTAPSESSESTVRKRNLESQEKTSSEASAKNNSTPKENLDDGDKPQPSNPLKWFGILVPQSLRNGQQNFSESLPCIIKIATLQSELNSVINTYNDLKKLKIEETN